MSVQPLFTPTPHGRSGSAQSHRHGTAHPHARWVDGSHADRAQAEYYAQRASAGLIGAEATAISADGFGFADTPGLG
jgi:N-ethylmaleimide reductase